MKMSLALIVAIMFVSFEGKGEVRNFAAPHDFKVVGYYFLSSVVADTLAGNTEYGFLNNITHLNLAFINPDTSGNFAEDLPIGSFIRSAHDKNVKVLASIAGGGPHAYYKQLLQGDKRGMFINNLLGLVNKYDLDGIDVDLEGDDIDDHYEAFVTELEAALKPSGKLITAAIATAYKDKLSDKALRQFDFINIMSYDRTGPWRPANPGQHAPYEMAEQDLNYWSKTRHIPNEKLVLGLPFYGYGFGAVDDEVVSMDYKEIISGYPNAKAVDTLVLPDAKVMYYNGAATIEKKTWLAIDKAGGIMIWQLLGDAPEENSLLRLINVTISKNKN